MSEGISYGGSLTTAEEDSANFEVIGYLQNYACNLVSAFWILCGKCKFMYKWMWMFHGMLMLACEGWRLGLNCAAVQVV